MSYGIPGKFGESGLQTHKNKGGWAGECGCIPKTNCLQREQRLRPPITAWPEGNTGLILGFVDIQLLQDDFAY